MLLLPATAADVKKVCRTVLCLPDRRLRSGGVAWRHVTVRQVTMNSGAFPLKSDYPVAIVGAGPVGLTTALALSYYEIPFVVFEANAGLSTET
jgi:threonine dehydrogenase-like Zn-dependent dehydrogenase